MLSWLLLLLGLLAGRLRPAAALHKSLRPDPASWTCLDASKAIPWASVNDDYCDCPDGSDEPGTSACPNATFYCQNEGHIGASIRSSRVNDGLCEYECCDGSDEQPGVCPNVCAQVGQEYRARVEAETKIRKTGAKVRSSYIAFAKKEKRRLEDLVASSSREVAQREKEVARLKDIIDRTESTSAAALELKKESPLYQSLLAHGAALRALKRAHEKLATREQTLADILSALRAGYNPNYQDMAVLEAVRGYEFYAGLPASNDRDRAADADGGGDGEGDGEKSEVEKMMEEEEELGADEWTREQLDKDLGDLLDTDHVSLLLEHDEHVGTGASQAGSILFDLSAYIPDALVPQYEALKDSVVSLLETLGIARAPGGTALDTSKARTAFQDAEHDLALTRTEKADAQRELARLFDSEWYGPEGEWKKLDGLCLSKDTGDYTYEVCLFGEARQKPNKGGSSFSLGKFAHWNTAAGAAPGTPEYYARAQYAKGARCWNGPERSVALVLACGTENALLGVAEPEKCEYQITGTSPALCRPLDTDTDAGAGAKKGKEEL
ncbi:endoplasmic reticulum protein [Phellopilus nigrolimitatus]|nr:endoplasmic reticulum protein [Phellopilus nigrolimitatus]